MLFELVADEGGCVLDGHLYHDIAVHDLTVRRSQRRVKRGSREGEERVKRG